MLSFGISHMDCGPCQPCQPCRPSAVQDEEKMPTSQEMAWSRGGKITSARSVVLKGDGQAPPIFRELNALLRGGDGSSSGTILCGSAFHVILRA